MKCNPLNEKRSMSIMSCASYENTLQIYSFLSSSAQELAEIWREKLQIANFSAADVGKWWKFSNIDFIKSLYHGLLFAASWR